MQRQKAQGFELFERGFVVNTVIGKSTISLRHGRRPLQTRRSVLLVAGREAKTSTLQLWSSKKKTRQKKQTNNTPSWWQKTAMPVQCTMFVTLWKRKREARHGIVYNGKGKGQGAVICAAKGLSGIACCCSWSLSGWFIDRRHRSHADRLSSRGPTWQLEKRPFLWALFLPFLFFLCASRATIEKFFQVKPVLRWNKPGSWRR